MKVRLLNGRSGPRKSYVRGEVIEVGEAEGQRLVDAFKATPVDDSTPLGRPDMVGLAGEVETKIETPAKAVEKRSETPKKSEPEPEPEPKKTTARKPRKPATKAKAK